MDGNRAAYHFTSKKLLLKSSWNNLGVGPLIENLKKKNDFSYDCQFKSAHSNIIKSFKINMHFRRF